MNPIETNIFPILNISDLNCRCDVYEIRNLRRDQDEYFQNRDSLVHDLSFKLQVPVQAIERGGAPCIVVPENTAQIPDRHLLVRTYVYLEKAREGLCLDFAERTSGNDAICLRFVQFMLQAPLWRNTRLWQPMAGMPFYEKVPAEHEGGIGRYQGFAARAVIAPSGRIGLCVDVRSKYVALDPLPLHLNRLTFRSVQGQRCVYRYGHGWFEIGIEALSDLNVSQEQIPTPQGPVSLIDFIARESRKPLPAELAGLAHDAAVIRYRNRRGEDRAAPAALCYPIRDNQLDSARRLYERAIMPPYIRRREIQRYVAQYLKALRFSHITLRVGEDPERVERRFFQVPDIEFGRGRKLSVRGTAGAVGTGLGDLGRKRLELLRDRKAGFFVREPFRRQYLVLPESVHQSWGEQFISDLKRTVDDLYPDGGGYLPDVVTYKDRGPRTYREQGKAILEAIGDTFMESAFALVMLHPTSDRRLRQHDLLAAMVIRELRNKDIFAAVNHSEMGERSYVLVTGRDGEPRYEIRNSERGRYLGYLRNVALNKILLTNGFWPFVLASPLHADLTIGIDVKNQTAGFTVVGRNGAYVAAQCEPSRQKERLLKDQVLTYLAKIAREESRRLSRPVNSIVLHRDGRCWQSEIDGALAAVAKLKSEGVLAPEATLTILEISKSAPVRLRFFEEMQSPQRGRTEVQNPQLGQYTIVNGTEGFVCSTGRAFPHKGTVQPLHVRCVLEGMPFVNALEDVFALTILAYSRPEDCSRYPVTIKLTDRWLDEDASEYDEDTLRYESEDDQSEEERAHA